MAALFTAGRLWRRVHIEAIRRRGYSGAVGFCVIVASYEAGAALAECLRSLTAQSGVSDVIVVDCSAENPAGILGLEFPTVQFIHFDTVRTIPELRWAGVEYAEGDYVAWIEARTIPSESWAQSILEAQAAAGRPAMVGGSIVLASSGYSRWQWAHYFCEYSAVRTFVGERGSPSGANLSFPLQPLRELSIDTECPWENEIEPYWRGAGYEVVVCSARVEYRPTLNIGDSTRQRFHYGRDFASRRSSGLKRVFYAVVSPAIFVVLLGRLFARAIRQACVWQFVTSLPATIWFTTSWALGESAGYWFGASKQRHIY